MIEYNTVIMPSETELRQLFDSVMWAKSLTDDELQLAIDNSSHLVTAWDGLLLVGLIRSMDDGVYSANIDLLLVRPDYQRQGIATTLIHKMLEYLKDIKFISVSPNEMKDFKLYQKCGFNLVEHSGQLQYTNT